MGVEEHRRKSRRSVRTAILTVSDTRTEKTDGSGRLIREMLLEAGHSVVGYEVVREEPELIRDRLGEWIGSDRIEAILVTGGTGLASRDSTFEIIQPLLDKPIDGVGELFRSLSFQEIGAAAMLSRAIGGVVSGKIVLAMPGSVAAVRLAMGRLILPELSHMVWLVTITDGDI